MAVITNLQQKLGFQKAALCFDNLHKDLFSKFLASGLSANAHASKLCFFTSGSDIVPALLSEWVTRYESNAPHSFCLPLPFSCI